MSTRRITSYDPTLSVEENAGNNNVSNAAIRAYIRRNNISRSTEKQQQLFDRIKTYATLHPADKPPKIAQALSLSPNTVRKYLKKSAPPKPKEQKITTASSDKRVRFLSASESQTDILKDILDIHLPKSKRFQCDLTAWKLGFYKDGIPVPQHRYDKYAHLVMTPQSIKKNPLLKDYPVEPLEEFHRSGWSDFTFESIVIDLPCSVESPSTKSRFDVSTKFSSIPELLTAHEEMLRLAHRKLCTSGILVYKTMDFTIYGTPYWLSDEVLNKAKEIGFELADKYILIDQSHTKIPRRRTRFTAAFPSHAYFFVFRKSAPNRPLL